MTADTPTHSRTTRDAILAAALELFSQRGFEGTSMRDIAAEAGITQGAIYKHFAGKEALLEAICALMEQADAEHAEDSGMPAEVPARSTETSRAPDAPSLAAFRAFTLGMFTYWASDPLAAPFRRMLEIDRFRNERMRALYRQYLEAGPLEYTQACLEDTGMPSEAARTRSLELWGAFRLLLDLVDASETPLPQAAEELRGILDGLLA